MLGKWGIESLIKTINYAQKRNLVIILDAKRNDIGSTAQAYAEAYFGIEQKDSQKELNIKDYIKNEFQVDAMTINPYLGSDGIKPFLKQKEKGAFALVRTSNSSAKEFQDLKLQDGKTIYQKMGELVTSWGAEVKGENGYSNLGAVIGATYPAELELLRKEMPETYFLIPGYGFQGGGPEDVVKGFNDDKLGAVINSSRGIIFAYKRASWSDQFTADEFGEAARKAASEMREEINKVLSNK